ncbi:MAG: HAD-IA family hydrolase [Clostridiales bacterium]|nr:HAD-IA family hydrolase [Clostridiales bacterium]
MTALLFDLDGTIADSLPLILKSSQAACGKLGLQVSDERIIGYIGLPLVQTGEILLGKGRGEEYLNVYQEIFFANHDREMRAFPGMKELLVFCREKGAKLGLVTSKTHRGACATLSSLELDGFFDAVVTFDDDCGHKPSPGPAFHALQKLGEEPRNSAFIGDSLYDMRCGKQAGMAACAVSWGAASADELLAENPDAVVNTTEELKAWLINFIETKSAKKARPR